MEMRSYMGVEYMRSGAIILLREMADAQGGQAPLPSRLKAKAARRKKGAKPERRPFDCKTLPRNGSVHDRSSERDGPEILGRKP